MLRSSVVVVVVFESGCLSLCLVMIGTQSIPYDNPYLCLMAEKTLLADCLKGALGTFERQA